MEYVTLANGVKMPILGYGVYQVTKEECERCVLDALEAGYRHIDTAQAYFNEEEVGAAIEKSGVPREEVFLTTKVWLEHYGYEQAKASVLESLRKLRTGYIDLFPRELAKITGIGYSTIKISFDILCLAVTAGMTGLFLGDLKGLGIGTILAAFTMGKVIGGIGDWLDKRMEFVSFIAEKN